MTRQHRERLRILAVHRYFSPDTPPYASLLRAIASHWASAGHRVDVLTSQPSYKPELSLSRLPVLDVVDGVHVRRLTMLPDRGPRLRRPRNAVRFSLLVFWRIMIAAQYDVVMCSTAPPVLLGWLTSVAARLRRAQFVYHCMDIHPEIGRLSGDFARPSVYRFLLRLDIATCRRAAAIVVLSSDMRAAIIERDPHLADRVVVLNNFDIPSYESAEPSPRPRTADSETLTVAFTGNVGRYQGLETIVKAVLSPDERLRRVRLVLMGEGGAKADLQKLVAEAAPSRRNRVVLLPHGTSEEARGVMREADLGLVSLVPGVIAYAYPSKTATYLSEGLPLLAAVEPDSELAHEIVDWGVGGVLSITSIGTVADDLAAWSGRKGELTCMRDRAVEAWRQHFAAEAKLKEWDGLLADLASIGTPA